LFKRDGRPNGEVKRQKVILAAVQAPPGRLSKYFAQCCNHDRQNIHDAHGPERDGDQ